MTTLRVAAVQFSVTEDVTANLHTCLRMTDRAVARGARVVVLPEFCNHVSWYDDRAHARRMAVTLDGPFVAALAAKAAEHGIHLMANCTLARPDGRTTGTNLLFGPTGDLLASSDKQVLMGSERDHLDPAVEASAVVDTEHGRLGMYSCMDGVINETPRMLAVGGAQVLLNSLNSFALDEASLHVPVRAVENRVWVVAANKVGPLVPQRSIEVVAEKVGVPVDLLHGAGESQIVAPDGTVVAIGPRTGEAVVVADIDVHDADDKQRPDGTDVLAARRPELYAAIIEAPVGRRAPGGAAQMQAAVICPAPGDDVHELLVEALGTGADLVVLPELAGPSADEIASAITAGPHRDALVVTTAAEGGTHAGLVVGADGVRLRQPQLHDSARHSSWATATGEQLLVLATPWGRLAVVVGDDALYPETFRLAALADADVVAVPFTVATASDLEPLLLERAAENRLNLAVASPVGEHGAGGLVPLSADFTLWTEWSRPFSGVISRPEPVRSTGPLTVGTLRPACAVNRFVTRGTDLVDGRPWALAGALAR
ncbi:carbon-nitrogen hydrolase [Nocardioides cavernae]|uniref:Carbon-nitrogen hydrolase n=1 Tax=Nocardioides cavernae TaxID=1921566 RepID=A0ABR8NFT0_9ACTN|nr:nitrilase-related carbon-nitrogen hydrolase [Nocardioides cavernae]MBD3926725.1 carbon-nitrogen hydrolase [Nocardioides cavernae]MBM7512447.1 putative amidohydrolase [Nocardioides cavernae]